MSFREFLIGVCVGCLVVVGGYYVSGDKGIVDQAEVAISRCESTLKRTEHCKIIAVPVIGETE